MFTVGREVVGDQGESSARPFGGWGADEISIIGVERWPPLWSREERDGWRAAERTVRPRGA